MNPVYKSKIKYSFKEYESQYHSSLHKYLNEHEDFGEIYFLENEFEFYSKLHHHCDLISTSKITKKQIEFLRELAPEIVKESTKNEDPLTWNFEQIEKYKASFKRILNFIDVKINDYKSSKSNVINTVKIDECKEITIVKNTSDDNLKSKIEGYLEKIVDFIGEDDYKALVDTLHFYLVNGKFPNLHGKFMFKKMNKKKVGWALKEVYKNLKGEKLSVEYLSFWKEHINLFHKETIEPDNFQKSKYYKTFTTNPSKSDY